MKILDELTDLKGPLVVSQCHRVDGQPSQLLNKRDEGLEVFLDRDMEGVSVFQIDGDWEALVWVLRYEG